MIETPRCRRCDTNMEEGFLADNASSGYVMQAAWFAGQAVQAKWLGMNLGTLSIKDRAHHPLVAYRCPICYGVEFFAPPADVSKEVLLRAASAGESTKSEELLRQGDVPQDKR